METLQDAALVAPIARQPAFALIWRRVDTLVFGTMIVAALSLQGFVGAYQTERGNYSDEAAHFMNGMVISDFAVSGMGENPIRFAARYYLDYPKIAPGMWPPLFHASLGLLLLSGLPAHASALALVGLAAAWTAWRLFRIVALMSARSLALVVATCYLLTPAVINMTSAVMLDIIVAAFAIEAAYWLSLYFESKRIRHAVLFGLFAAGGCLTKGNGLAILLMPAVLMILTRRIDMLARAGLYVAAAIVLVLAAPLVSLSFYLDSTIGDFGTTSWVALLDRVQFYGRHWIAGLGLPILVLAALGVMATIVRRDRDATPTSATLAAGLASLLISTLLFHFLNPHKVVVPRYLTMAIAPLFGLVIVAADALAAELRRPAWKPQARVALIAVAAAGVIFTPTAPIQRTPLGFRAAANWLLTHGGLSQRTMMVISDENGEGAFVAEVAANRPAPAARVIRASKLMATDDWGGTRFQLRFPTAGALEHELEDLHVELLVVDGSLEARKHPLWQQTHDLLGDSSETIEPLYDAGGARQVRIYRLRQQSAGPAKPLQFAVSSPFGRFLNR